MSDRTVHKSQFPQVTAGIKSLTIGVFPISPAAELRMCPTSRQLEGLTASVPMARTMEHRRLFLDLRVITEV